MNKFFVVLLTLPLFLGSCNFKTLFQKKKPTSGIDSALVTNNRERHFIIWPQPDTARSDADTTDMKPALIAMVAPIWANRLVYNTFSAKCKVHFESPDDQQDFTANVRMRHDTALWIDISALGGIVHAARVLITTDSVFMINYLQKEVTKMPLAALAKMLPTDVDYPTLQNFIVGEPLKNGTIIDVSEVPGNWLVRVRDSAFVQQLSYKTSDSTMSVNQVNTSAEGGPEAVINAAGYVRFGDRRISGDRKVHISNAGKRFYLEMDLQNMNFDQPVDMPFNIPKNYNVK